MSVYRVALLGDSMIGEWGPDCTELKEALLKQFNRTEFVIENHGVRDSRAGYAFWRVSNDYPLAGEFRRSVSAYNPNIVVVESMAYSHKEDGEAGLEEYRDMLRRIFDEIRQTTSGLPMLCLTIPPHRERFMENVPGYKNSSLGLRQRMADHVLMYLKAARELAATEKWPVADVAAEIDKQVAAGVSHRRFVNQSDNLHPSRFGYFMTGQILYRSIDGNNMIVESSDR